jgi:hypothetical protein
MVRLGVVLSMACALACGQPADAPKAAGSAASSGAVQAVAATPFLGRFPQDCEHWPHNESLKTELTEKALGLLEGLQGSRTKALLERIHPGGLLFVQTLPDPEVPIGQKRETLVPRNEVLQHFAQGGGAWVLDGFSDPIRSMRKTRVGAHWDVLDGHRQLCAQVDGTVGMFDGKLYVVINATDREHDEGRNTQVFVVFDRDSRGVWLVAALIRPYQPVE